MNANGGVVATRAQVRASYWNAIERLDSALECLADAAESVEHIEGPWAFNAGTVFGQCVGAIRVVRALRDDMRRGAEEGRA